MPPTWRKFLIATIAIFALVALPLLLISSPVNACVTAIAGICLYLWISEVVPPFVPTLILWGLVPLILGPLDSSFSINKVLGWSADPIVALFFGGFTLAVATQKFGLDRQLATVAIRYAGGSISIFLLLLIFITAFLSMWLSNIAAAALVFACLRPLLDQFPRNDLVGRVLLIGVAFAANLGGMATPIGTGPNGIAIAFIEPTAHVSFVGWMAFALPLTVGMLLFVFSILWFRIRKATAGWEVHEASFRAALCEGPFIETPQAPVFYILLGSTALLWLTEPWHHISAAVVAVAAAAALFLLQLLKKDDLKKIDWSTLLLIAGGISIGRMLEQSGMIVSIAELVPFTKFHPAFTLLILSLTSALLAALMSNTATAVLLIPLASVLLPFPSTAILIAISASFGMPFVISTPPNAMAFGEGRLKFGDLFWPGIVLMLFGCIVVSLTGPAVLNFLGIP